MKQTLFAAVLSVLSLSSANAATIHMQLRVDAGASRGDSEFFDILSRNQTVDVQIEYNSDAKLSSPFSNFYYVDDNPIFTFMHNGLTLVQRSYEMRIATYFNHTNGKYDVAEIGFSLEGSFLGSNMRFTLPHDPDGVIKNFSTVIDAFLEYGIGNANINISTDDSGLETDWALLQPLIGVPSTPVSIATVPLPASLSFLLTAILGLLFSQRRILGQRSNLPITSSLSNNLLFHSRITNQ